MSPSEHAEHLEEAARHIEAVLEGLNEIGHPCEHCGLTTRENFTEYQMGVSLRAIKERCEKYAAYWRKPERAMPKADPTGSADSGGSSGSSHKPECS